MPLAGEKVRASDVVPDAWLSYTPVWSASGTAVSLGNGTITGRYFQTNALVHVKIVLTMGSTTTFGTAFYRFSLPVTPAVDGLLPTFFDDVSASRRYRGVARIILASTTGDNMRIACDDGVTGGAGPTAPVTFANGDSIILSGAYEPQ